MRYIAQIITNNILQSSPSITITYLSNAKNKKYIFNVHQHYCRFMKRHFVRYGAGMTVFFTKYDAAAMSGLMRLLLELNVKGKSEGDNLYGYKSFNTQVYFHNSAFKFWRNMKKSMGFRLLPYSFYNYDTKEVLLGLSNPDQNAKLFKQNKKKWVNGDYTDQELRNLEGGPSNAADKIVDTGKHGDKEKEGMWIYADQYMEVRTFVVGDQPATSDGTFYCHICTPLKSFLSTDPKKLAQLKKQHPQIGQAQTSSLFQQGSITLKSGQTLNLSLLQTESPQSSLLILHYNSPKTLQNLSKNPNLQSSLLSLSKKNIKIKNIIHIVEGDSSTLLSEEFGRFRQLFDADVQHVLYYRGGLEFGDRGLFWHEVLGRFPNFLVCYQLSRYGFWRNIVDSAAGLYAQLIKPQFRKALLQNQHKKSPKQGKLTISKSNKQLVFSPQKFLTYRQIPHPPGYKQNQINIPQVKPKQHTTPYQLKLKQKLASLTLETDPTVVFLGTNSMRSSNVRNVSGILVRFQGLKGNMGEQKGEEKGKGEFSILMDCGEGIHNQFVNHFGVKYYQQILKLRILFLTHLHQDHCAGLFNFLSQRNSIIKQKIEKSCQRDHKLFLIMPQNMIKWYEAFNKNTQKIDEFTQIIITQSIRNPEVEKQEERVNRENVKFFSKNTKKQLYKQDRRKSRVIGQGSAQGQDVTVEMDRLMNACMSSEEIPLEEQQQSPNDIQKTITQFNKAHEQNLSNFHNFLHEKNLTKFYPIPVFHCVQSYGLVLQHKGKVKISYSGDCRPSSLFLRMAKYSTLFIHEATFSQDNITKAKFSNHSTTSQAIELGWKSNSVMVALTHFTPSKYFPVRETIQSMTKLLPKIGQDYITKNVFEASDHLQFKLSEMYQLPHYCNQIQLFQ